VSRSGRRRLVVVAAAVALLGVACSSDSSADGSRDGSSTTIDPADVPAFAGAQDIPAYTGDQTRTVLLIGDSVMQAVGPFLQVRMAQVGIGGPPINEGHSGSMIVGPVGIDWQAELPGMLDRYQPDIVVAHFAGHGIVPGAAVGTPEWYEGIRQATLTLVDEVLDRGIDLYWVLPPVESWPGGEVDGEIPYPPEVFVDAADWYRTELVALRPDLHLVDWRTAISPNETWTESLRFPDGQVRMVRVDPAHLAPWGAFIAADLTVAAIRPEWG
jgi:hypothetical protein